MHICALCNLLKNRTCILVEFVFLFSQYNVCWPWPLTKTIHVNQRTLLSAQCSLCSVHYTYTCTEDSTGGVAPALARTHLNCHSFLYVLYFQPITNGVEMSVRYSNTGSSPRSMNIEQLLFAAKRVVWWIPLLNHGKFVVLVQGQISANADSLNSQAQQEINVEQSDSKVNRSDV